jgi:FK506-binding protein 1
MKAFLRLILIVCVFAYVFTNTSDPEFENLFSVRHIKAGDGKNFPPAGSQVSVHYTGTFPESGKKFDSSVDRNRPFTFTLQRGHVIKCWDQVVAAMTLGEKIYVICPSRLAYGERGAGGVIPPNADIAFEIELLSYEGGDL